MAHLAKYTMKDLGGLLAHCKRTKINTENIDPERSKENRILHNMRCYKRGDNQKLVEIKSPEQDFKDYFSTLEHSKRKDLKCICSWVVTLPDELMNEPKEKQMEFFYSVRDFMIEKYGKDNRISLAIHFDEQGKPHMHYLFIPVKTYLKDGIEHKKVCAKEVLTKKHLQSFHGELSAYVEKAMGQKLSIENGRTKDGNRTINQLKTETLRKENAKLKQELKQANLQIQYYKEGANQSMTYDEWYRKNHKAKIVPTAKQAEKSLNRGSNGFSR